MSNDLNLGDLGITINLSEGEPASAKFTLPDGSVVTRPFTDGELNMRLGLGLGLGYQPAVGGGASAPSNTGLPVISGTATSGQTLSATNGTWNDGGAEISGYAYQWNADGVAISGATSSTFGLTSAQIGAVITVTVTATNAAGSTAATSTGTAPVTAGAATAPVFVGGALSSVSGAAHTFTAQSIGAAAVDRLVMVTITGKATTNRTLSAVTIGGNAATIAAHSGSSTRHAGIAYLSIAAGTSANIVVTFTGIVTDCTIAVYTATGRSSATPTATSAGVDATGTGDQTVAVTGGGFALFVGARATNNSATTLTSITNDYNNQSPNHGAAHGSKAVASSQNVTSGISPSGVAAVAGASWF